MRRDSISAPAVGTGAAGPALPYEVVLLDALGTLIELEPPWWPLVDELTARGVAGISAERAERAMRAEMAYYRAHHLQASDPAGLKDLRRRCAGIVASELALTLPLAEVEETLLAALRFRAFPEVPGALSELRTRGHRLVVVSNWDVSLHEVIERTGLSSSVDGVVTSAEEGVAKPAPAIFLKALELAGGVAPARALHVGDSIEHDVEGARAAGIEAILIARDGGPPRTTARTIPALDALLR